VALDTASAPLGVAWLTHFTSDDPGYGFVADDVPEVSIWVASSNRRAGIGSRLLQTVIDEAHAQDMTAICLSAEDGNPARRLYERHGFTPLDPPVVPGTLVLDLWPFAKGHETPGYGQTRERGNTRHLRNEESASLLA
jgi:GNAT superfamily N-acetyltransferase